MKRALSLLVFCLAALGFAQDTYLGLYLQGSKLGYSSYSVADDTLNGKPVKRNNSKTIINTGLLGASMQMQIDSVSWSDAAGRPLKMRFVSTSSGRTQTLDARFEGSKIYLDIDNSGTKSKKTLDVPNGGTIVDDPMTPILNGMAVGTTKSFYILDPTTAALVKNEIALRGPAEVTVKGKTVKATKVEVIDPRANTTIYVTPKGDLIKAEGPMGIEMIPETKEEALGEGDGKGNGNATDLAEITKIKPDKPIQDPANLGLLKIKLTGKDLTKIPSDQHQTAVGTGTSWILTIHPPKLTQSAGLTIAQARASQPKWVKPTMLVSSGNPEFIALAKRVVGKETNAKKAALKIKAYVQRTMRPNAGIGVLRDANEIIKTKEGVCRDYAILTATLMRAAGIPAKLASGLVNWDGSFYYHAWVEIWDGKRWLGMDSTTPDEQISAAHVKLGDGNVEEAFTFTFLDRVKVAVLEARRW